MSPLDAIGECRRGHEIGGARWPMPLINYLANLPDDRGVFDWLCSCVGDLLDHFGKSTAEIREALSSARGQAAEGADREAIEKVAWVFWSRRLPEDATFTAVAQLLFALSRADRSDPFAFAGACSTPICLLEGLEACRGDVFDRVISHFSNYVGGSDDCPPLADPARRDGLAN
jgi:hypothetical protein